MVDFAFTYIEKVALAPKRFFLLAMLHSDGVSTTTTTSRSWKVAKKSTKGIATLLAALKEASKARDAKRGRELHSDAIASGVAGDIFVGSSLVDMYCNCGLMGEAREVFDAMPSHDIVVTQRRRWIGGARPLLADARRGCSPNSRTFVAAAKACSSIATAEKEEEVPRGSEVCSTSKMGSLEIGMAINSQALERRCGSIFVESCLVDMYAKCGGMDDARRVFESMERRNMVAWTSLMLGYAESGDGQAALELFQVMERENCPRDARTFVAAVKACSSLAMAAKEGSSSARAMRALETGMCSSRSSQEWIRCGSMEDARRIFERFASHDVVSWTALILGYGDNGENEVAVELFLRMVHQGYHANARTFVAVIKACSSLAEEEQGGSVIKFRALATGMAIHRLAAANGGCDTRDVFVGNTLIDMYAKCGTLVDSRRVFDAMLTRDGLVQRDHAGLCRE
ncbi:pentatricopeptide repeat-containing protein At4g18520, chloroplastic-like [Selaginella moellendorffii]|uniref:pentatricopeptide repeat-containing protein At4g18520, chloroplastic-like n=1 Tax=Selaginella moellendorffii TaxID=88036 RepID=UPI000D1D0E09|nr:pentatricopeptide repeat-containing protein At4g18520, chloroplastic-like [Selaginella moellendorffii]|eukprot:XP_024540461.1 pentatricopeptide repeat-containing protein At4g18520, chloroplastic-like [Selaginella moellendorffii]